MPTPKAQDGVKGNLKTSAEREEAGFFVDLPNVAVDLAQENQLFPTPKARDAQAEGYEAGLRRSQPQIGTVIKGIVDGDERVLLRSPKASEGQGGALGEAEALRRGNTVGVRDQIMDLVAEQGLKVSRADLMPTPTAVDGNTVAKSELDADDPKHRLKVAAQVLAREGISWGKFEPAIRRWEQVLGRPAPAPTKPDGKDGAHRLSSLFTEWMMGLPDGWITGHGLSRNDELKMAGNGVVPQQAEMALRILLENVDF